MGSGSWTREKFETYSTTRGRRTLSDGSLDIKNLSASQIYKSHCLQKELNPYNVIRECRDSEEHPNTIPVILGLDVTGSMGSTAVEVAAELNTLMTELYSSVKDVEFLVMGIGDFAYDSCPLQVSQFESDIRIAEQLDKIYFEFGGGGNSYESYTAAWQFGLKQTDCDCWKRGKRGIIITMGDENLNPYINGERYKSVTGVSSQGDIETKELFDEVSKKFDIYHINVSHNDKWGPRVNKAEWYAQLGQNNFFTCEVKAVPQIIAQIIKQHETDNWENNSSIVENNNSEGISW